MKSVFLPVVLSLVVAFTVVSAAIVRVEAMAQKQEYVHFAGVGPAVAQGVDVDKLPQKARDFIAHHIKECEVSHVNNEFESGEYEVYLTDGVEVNFNAKGDFEQIDAPVGYVLTQSLVRELVPAKCYKNMIEMDCINNVTSIGIDNNGYNIDFAGTDLERALYDMTGKLVAIYD